MSPLNRGSAYESMRETTTEEARQVGLKIFKFADRRDKVLMAIGCTTALLSGAGMPVYSQINGNIIGKMASTDGDIADKLSQMALALVIVGIIMMILQGVRGFCIHYTTMRQASRIKLLYFKALMRQEVAWHDKHPPGELTSRMDGDVKVIERAMGDNLMLGLQHIGTVVFAIGIAFYNGWELTLFMLGALPFIAGVSILFGRIVVNQSLKTRKGYGTAGGIALEAIDNIKTVQVFGREEFEAARFSAAVAPAMNSGMMREIATFMTTGCNNFIIYVIYGLGFWFGAYLIHWDRNNVGQVLVVFFSCLMASFAIGRFSPCLSIFIEGAGAASQVFEVIDRIPAMNPMTNLDDPESIAEMEELIAKQKEHLKEKEEQKAKEAASKKSSKDDEKKSKKNAKKDQKKDDDKKNDKKAEDSDSDSENANILSIGVPLPDRKFKDSIVFEDVAFCYPTRKDDKLFKKLNVTIKKGQTVAFSGASGCGKSSIIGLLQRFYDPTKGRVTVDGFDLRDLNLRSWRDCISIVSQEPKLFTGTVMENVKIAKPDATDEEVFAACRKAHVHQVIEKLPDQYNTLVGTGGSQLSGGQKQRVAIARALIRNPQILILDEATSALDRKSEVEVQAALESIMFKSRNDTSENGGDPLTVVVIAHRLATIQNADVIHYIEHDDIHGSWIEESGSYNDLIDLNGHFAAMTRKQSTKPHNAPTTTNDADKTTPSTSASLAAITGEKKDHSDNDAVFVKDDTDKKESTDDEKKDSSKKKDKKSKKDKKDKKEKKNKEASDGVVDEDEDLYKDAIAKSLKELDQEGVDAMPSQHMRVLSLCRGDRWAIIVGCFGCLMAGLDYPAYAIIFTYMLEVLAKVMFDESVLYDEIPMWCSMFFVVAVCSLISHGLMCAFAYAGERLTLKLRRSLFYSILRQDMTFFDTPGRDSSTLATILSTDTEVVHGLWGPSIGSKIQLFSTLVGGIVISFVYSWRCAFVTLACMPSFIILLIVTSILLKSFGAGDDNAIKAESLTNIRTVVSLNLQDVMISRYVEHVTKLDHKQRYNSIIKAIQGGGMGFIMFAIMALIAWYSGQLISGGTNTFLEVMIAQTSIMTAMRGITEASEISAKFADSGNASKRVFYIIDRQPPIISAPPADLDATYDSEGQHVAGSGKQSNANNKNAPDAANSDDSEMPTRIGDKNAYQGLKSISLKSLKFRYPARPEAPLLRGVDLDLEMPKTYGLMGETGCGKSTLVGLLTRFYDPAAGDITIEIETEDSNNIDSNIDTAEKNNNSVKTIPMKELNLAEWRETISLVLQEPALFSGTIKENILYSKPDATDAEVEQAARYASIHDDIMLMPDGYNTNVGYKGQALSGGQKQRVAIARALIRKPRMLLMDEATSALDNATEGRVEQGIRDACADNKMIVVAVAHRLTTIRDSDCIAVMEAGKVKEKGNHDELIALGGHYKDRWKLFETAAEREKSEAFLVDEHHQ